MKETNKKALVCHLALMGVMILGNIMFAVMIMRSQNNIALGNQLSLAASPAARNVLFCICLSNILALFYGIIYFVSGSSKAAASLYKAFLFFTIVIYVLRIALSCVLFQGVSPVLVVYVITVTVLLVMILVKDLGKKRTWILYAVFLCLNLISAAMALSSGIQSVVYQLIPVISRLLLTGTIGLAIKGKYDDKDARGTK